MLVTHPKCYIDKKERCKFGGKPSEWRWGWVLYCYHEKFWNFVACVEPDIEWHFFAFLPFDCPAYSLQEPVLHQSNGTDRNVCIVEFNVPFDTV